MSDYPPSQPTPSQTEKPISAEKHSASLMESRKQRFQVLQHEMAIVFAAMEETRKDLHHCIAAFPLNENLYSDVGRNTFEKYQIQAARYEEIVEEIISLREQLGHTLE